MTLTKQEYDAYVKPFFDDLYSVNLDLIDDVLVGDFIRKIIDAEFDIIKLGVLLKGKTPLQAQFLNKYCSETITNLEEFIKKEDVK